jgi:hypothetical protein
MTGMIAESVAGEGERRTLETLLASRPDNPPLAAAGLALALAPTAAPAIAYIAGTLGALLGADATPAWSPPG